MSKARIMLEARSHNLFVYENNDKLKAFYTDVCKQFLGKNKIVVLLLHNESSSSLEQNLEDGGIDVRFYKRGGMLFIFEAAQKFFGSEYGFVQFVSLLHDNALKAGKNGICILINVNAFGARDNGQLIEYERLVGWASRETITLVCMYDIEQIKSLGEEEIDAVLTHHHRIVHKS